MSKLAATLASLLLIASSIGVNIARYPQVGRTAEAGQPTDEVVAANAPPTAQQSNSADTAGADPPPARETESEPAKPPQSTQSPRAAAVAPAENAPVEGPRDPKPAAGTAAPQTAPVVPILDVRPMVPIASLPAAAGVAEPLARSNEAQRLPAIEPDPSTVAGPPDEIEKKAPYPTTSTP